MLSDRIRFIQDNAVLRVWARYSFYRPINSVMFYTIQDQIMDTLNEMSHNSKK